jgi:hypothetical protein
MTINSSLSLGGLCQLSRQTGGLLVAGSVRVLQSTNLSKALAVEHQEPDELAEVAVHFPNRVPNCSRLVIALGTFWAQGSGGSVRAILAHRLTCARRRGGSREGAGRRRYGPWGVRFSPELARPPSDCHRDRLSRTGLTLGGIHECKCSRCGGFRHGVIAGHHRCHRSAIRQNGDLIGELVQV